MEPVLILLGVLVVVGTVLYAHDRFTRKPGQDPEPVHEPAPGCTDSSCALHDSCPSEQLLAGVCNNKVVYYDDEELDAFAGRDAQNYNTDEVEQFRDVLYTLRHEEIVPWHQSLSRRGIQLPAILHDELIMLANEQRT